MHIVRQSGTGHIVRFALLGSALLLVAFLVLFPMAMLVIGSFGAALPNEAFADPLRAWRSVPTEVGLLWNTLAIAVGATIIAVVFGSGLAWILGRTDVPGAGRLESLVVVPFYLTPLILAVGWAILGSPSRAGLLNRLAMDALHLQTAPLDMYTAHGIAWVIGLAYTPFCFLFTLASLKAMDPALEESSAVLGAGTRRTALRVTFPLVLPAITGGSLLTFVLAISQFGAPAILGMPRGLFVVTTEIYQITSAYSTDYAKAAALGLSLIAFSFLGVWVQFRVLGNRRFTTVTGRGFRPKVLRLGVWRWPLFLLCLAFVGVAVVLPLGAIALMAFLQFPTTVISEMKFTLANFEFVANYPTTVIAIRNTIILGLGAASAGVILSVLISWILTRTKLPFRGLLESVSLLPLAVPATVFALALLWAWIRFPLGVYGTMWVLLIAYVTIFLPFGIRAVNTSLRQIDPSLEEAALVLGGSWLRSLRSITLPLLAPGLWAAWVLLFVSSVKELSASVLLYTSHTVVLSVAVFGLWLSNSFTQVAAMALVQALLLFATLWLTGKIGRSSVALY